MRHFLTSRASPHSRLFGFRPDTPAPLLSLLACVPVAERCLLRLRWLGSAQLAVAGTDGALCLCDVTGVGGRSNRDERELRSEAAKAGVKRACATEDRGVEMKQESGLTQRHGEKSESMSGYASGGENLPTLVPGNESSQAPDGTAPASLPGGPARTYSGSYQPVRLPSLHQSGINALAVSPDATRPWPQAEPAGPGSGTCRPLMMTLRGWPLHDPPGSVS